MYNCQLDGVVSFRKRQFFLCFTRKRNIRRKTCTFIQFCSLSPDKNRILSRFYGVFVLFITPFIAYCYCFLWFSSSTAAGCSYSNYNVSSDLTNDFIRFSSDLNEICVFKPIVQSAFKPPNISM